MQLTEHCPDEQTCPDGHGFPQAPQLFASVVRLAQYVGPEVGHAVYPAVQETTQVLAEQISPDAQWLPHAPQLFTSFVMSAQ